MRDDTPHRSEAGVRTRRVETGMALALLAVGAIVAIDSYRLGSRWGDDGPQSGYFPFYIGLLLCIASLANLAQQAFTEWKRRERFQGAIAERESVFVSWSALRQVFAVLLPALVYVAGVQLIGIYVASAVYITLFMVRLGDYSWLKSAVVGVMVSAVLFGMFEVWFKVPLYKGLYDPLFWLGF